jgi:thiol-disulfide isomerase/thioredoxin
MSSSVKRVSTTAQFEDMTSSTRPAAAMFGALWHRQCKRFMPKFERLADKFPRIDFYYIDNDDLPNVLLQVGVSKYPTVLVVAGGKQVGMTIGEAEHIDLHNLLKQTDDSL